MKIYKVEVYDCGDVYWFNTDGQLHRENGPAVERKDGEKVWYINGLRHRVDGPAVIRADGYLFYFWMGKPCSKEDHGKYSKSRDGEIIEEHGRKYKLVEITN